MSDLAEPLCALATHLTATKIAHAVIGGHAVNAWAEPRMTGDINLTIVADTAQQADLIQRMESAGWQVQTVHGGGLPSGPDFIRLVHPDYDSPVELQTAKTPFQQQVVTRAQPSTGALRVATPEDLIVLKLIAFRAKDRGDLAALVERPDLDWDYVERWAAAWQVTDRLERIR